MLTLRPKEKRPFYGKLNGAVDINITAIERMAIRPVIRNIASANFLSMYILFSPRETQMSAFLPLSKFSFLDLDQAGVGLCPLSGIKQTL